MQLREWYPEFQRRHAEILAISNEDQKRGAKLKEKLGLPFPVLADTHRRVILGYGVFQFSESRGRPIARAATLVLDTEGVVRYRYVGESVSDRPAIETILEAIPECNTNEWDA